MQDYRLLGEFFDAHWVSGAELFSALPSGLAELPTPVIETIEDVSSHVPSTDRCEQQPVSVVLNLFPPRRAEYGRFTFRGTAGTEHLKVDAPTTFDRNIALRGGKDSYESNSLGGKATRIKGDGGHNQLLLELNSHDRVRADLSRYRVTATKAGVEESIRVRGFDDLTVTAKRADVIGTNRANHIIVIACRTTIIGMKGRDGSSVELSTDTYGGGLLVPRCSNYKATINGGPGNDNIAGSTGSDRLIGGPGNDAIIGRGGDDRLIGGPGRDSVRGREGRDVCQGEKIRNCEKRI